MAIIDACCGGGLYRTENGQAHDGSPIIILKALKEAVAEIQAHRVANNIKRPLNVHCRVFFVDNDKRAIDALKVNSAPFLIPDSHINLQITPFFIHKPFSSVYRDISKIIGNRMKAIYLVDPCGYKEVPLYIIKEIMMGGKKRELIWTFMVDPLRAYAHENSIALKNAGYQDLLTLFEKHEKPSGFNVQNEIYHIVKRNVGTPFFTPFAIKQQKGWNYWLIHMAWHHKASEVMKDVEHRHFDQRIHYGGAGLNMMASASGTSYLFTHNDEERGVELLNEQLPEMLSTSEFKKGVTFNNFMIETYNETPRKSNMIKNTLLEHDDIEILTKNGKPRRSINRIATDDVIKLKDQMILI